MTTDTRTPNAGLAVITPTRSNWADAANGNFKIIDAIMGTYFIVNSLQGVWANSTSYAVNDSVIDEVTSIIWQCQVAHISAGVPTTFAAERAAHPTYWNAYTTTARYRGQWLPNTGYAVNDFIVNGPQYAVCISAHVSGAAFALDLAAGKWAVMIDLSAVGVAVLPVPGGVPDANKFTVLNSTGTGYTIVDAGTALGLLGATTIGKAVLTADSQAAALAAIGAEPEGSYQPLDANLTAVANTITSNGLAWVGLSSKAAMKAYLNLETPITPMDYGAVGNGLANDSDALDAFHAAVSTGLVGDYQNKTYKFTRALLPIVGNNIRITGSDAQLVYSGVSTNENLYTVGDIGVQYNRAELSGFTIGSTTTMTGGYAISFLNIYKVDYDKIKLDDERYGYKLYHGIRHDTCTLVYAGTNRVCVPRNGLTLKDTVEMHCGEMFLRGNGDGVNPTTGTGILIGGGCAAVYLDGANQLLADVGLQIDNSLSAVENIHIFGGKSLFDTNYTNNVVLNDSVVNAIAKVFECQNMWTASSTTGNGFKVTAWGGTSGRIVAGNILCLNNYLHGFNFTDVAVRFEISLSAFIEYNGVASTLGYGVNAATAMDVYSDAIPYNNHLGAYSTNIVRWHSRGFARQVTINAGASAPLHPTLARSGVVLVTNNTNGDLAQYSCSGGFAVGVSIGTTWEASTTTPAASKSSVAVNGGGTNYEIYNGWAGARTFLIDVTVTRGQF